VLVAAAHELMQDEGDFVGMGCAPGNDALELEGIVGDGADFHQLGFDDLRVSHSNSSMAHSCSRVAGDQAAGASRATGGEPGIGMRDIDDRRPRKVELALTGAPEPLRRRQRGNRDLGAITLIRIARLRRGNWDACIVGASHLYFECGGGLA